VCFLNFKLPVIMKKLSERWTFFNGCSIPFVFVFLGVFLILKNIKVIFSSFFLLF
jgi:hypothetical protein